ncbi:hypothetical protein [Pontiella agarivorans]|uniref:Lipoprotein n=1 Tax=Pontiella agarivorans TaxID=3038953 RepID=A0ABU5MW97_9BACT|nr:hypothetical protein [Pontiella agarivorans]MDZ8118494.1 hypothetical protein [Pontiella agarivorans]
MTKNISLSLISTFALLLTGCSTVVKTANLSDDAEYYWLGSSSSNTKTIFNINDEKVTLHVVFKPNFSWSIPTFIVEWIEPDSSVYLSRPITTKYGNNSVLITSLPIKGNMPSRSPGEWRVQLKKDDAVLVDFPFIIEK